MVDCHCHTTASDGIMSPKDLVRKACSEGIDLIAVADHDCIDGVDEAVNEALQCGMRCVPCIEFSVACAKGDFHLLGYNVRYKDPQFVKELQHLRAVRENRIPAIVDNLRAAGLDITLDDINAESKGAVPGKPHVARALVKKGIARTFEEAFDSYLGTGKPGDVPKKKISPEEAFALIASAGGKAVIAHPKSLELESFEEFERFIEKYKPMGLCGVEAFASMHDDDDVIRYSEIASRYGLICTGGSDFHGDKDERLGYFGAARMIPLQCADDLLRLIGGAKCPL